MWGAASIEGPWRTQKAWMTHAPAVGVLAATVRPITAEPVLDSQASTRDHPQFRPAALKCRRRPVGAGDVIPSTPPSLVPSTASTVHHQPSACLFFSSHGRAENRAFGFFFSMTDQDRTGNCVSHDLFPVEKTIRVPTQCDTVSDGP